MHGWLPISPHLVDLVRPLDRHHRQSMLRNPCRRLLRRFTTSLGDQERMLAAINCRAERLFAAGGNAEGVEALEAVHKGLLEIYGRRHPHTINTASSLAQKLLLLGGREDESETLARAAYADVTTLLGEAHPDSRLTGSTLGQVLVHVGKLSEATEVLSSVYRSSAAACDEEEQQVTCSNLAQVLMAQGRLQEAELFAREALRLSAEQEGDHGRTALAELHSTADLLSELGQLDEAEAIMRAAHDALLERHGLAHEDTLAARSSLARLLASHDETEVARMAEAGALMRESLDASRSAHGVEHDATLAAVSNLSQLLYKRGGDDDAALALAEEGVALSTSLLGHSHEHTDLMRQLLRAAARRVDRERSLEDASYALLASWPPPGAAFVDGVTV